MSDNDFPYTVITADGTFSGRLTEEDVLEVKELNLEPVYENTIKFLGLAVINGSHEKPATALWSILDQMRYLTQTDLPAALRVVEYFKNAAEMANNFVGNEDQHLEADYEDRGGYPDLDGVGNFDYSPELDG